MAVGLLKIKIKEGEAPVNFINHRGNGVGQRSRTVAVRPRQQTPGRPTTGPSHMTSGSAKAEPRGCRTINLFGFSSPSSRSPQIEGAAHTLHLSIWSFIYTLEANEPSQTLDGQDVNDLN